MGKITGFMEFERVEEGHEPVPKRVKNYREFVFTLNDDEAKVQGARCMDCGIPFCNSGCPVNNIIPGLERPGLPRSDWKNALDDAALDQQLPRVHRPHLPGAVRGGVHAQHQRRPGRHQVDRARDHRQAPGTKAGSCRSRRRARPARRSPWSARARPAWPRAQQLARAGHDVTVFEKNDRDRRPAALRHPRLQDGEVAHRPPHRADAGRGRRRSAPACSSASWPPGEASPTGAKETHRARELLARVRRRACSPAAPSSRATCRCPGRELDGVHFAMEFLPQQNKVNRRRQGRAARSAPTGKHVDRHRRRRHRLATASARRNRHGAKSRHPVRAAAAAARAREQAAGVAVLADQAAHLVVATRKAASASSRSRPRSSSARAASVKALKAVRVEWQGGKMVEVPGTEQVIPAELVLLAMGFVSPLAQRCSRRSASSATRAATPRRRTDGDGGYATNVAEGVRRRRHAARPVARGLGDPRRPPGARAVDEYPDGFERAAALSR